MLGQRYCAALTRANARRVKTYAWASGDKSKKISSLQPLFIYIYGLQLCLPPDYKHIPAAPCKRARAWLNLSEYFRYKIILPLAWTLNETIPMLRKHRLTSAFLFCMPQFYHRNTWYAQKPLLTMRDLWRSQKWKGNATCCLAITLQLPSHTTTLETVSCFVVLSAEKIHLSQSFQLTPLFLGLLEDAAIFPLQAQMSKSAESWRPAQHCWVNEQWGKLGDGFVKISAVARGFLWGSVQARWSNWDACQHKRISSSFYS